MVIINRGDTVKSLTGLRGIVKSNGIVTNSTGRPIVSVNDGDFIFPWDVAVIVEVNGVAVSEMEQQLDMFRGDSW